MARTTRNNVEPVTLSSPGFVGRTPEVRALRQVLTRPQAVVLVEGEAGIGKSRLLHEVLLAPASSRSFVVSCPPVREPFTLGPIVDGLRQIAGPIAQLRLSPLAGALRPLFPEWADDLPPLPEPPDDASAARHRLFRALAEVLDSLAPRVLVVEDVHWADEATLEFLLFLVNRRPTVPSLVLTYRPEDVPVGSLLLRLSSRVPADSSLTRIALRPLDVAETSRLVSSMLGGESISEEFAQYLHEHTDGLPLALEETMRLLGQRRDVGRRGGEWVRRALRQLAVPATVRDAVLERYERFDAPAQHVLRAAAVLADPFDEPTLLAVADLPPEQAGPGLAEALESSLIAEDERGLMAYRHSMAGRVVYGAMAAPERRRMHLRAGAVLEALALPPVPRLAHHFRNGGQSEKWRYYGERAADIAASAGDETTSITLLNDLLATPGPAATTQARLAKKLATVSSARRSTSRELTARTIQTFRAVLDGPDLTPVQKGEVRAVLGRLLITIGDFDAARTELELAIPALQHDPLTAAQCMIYLGGPRADPLPVDTHLTWLRRAEELPIDSFAPVDRINLNLERMLALVMVGEESGWSLIAQAAAEATAIADNVLIMKCALYAGHLGMTWGRYTDAARELEFALKMASVEDYPRMRSAILAGRIQLDFHRGAWSGLAERAAALELNDDAAPLDELEATLVLAWLDAAAGDRQNSERRLRLLLDRLGPRGSADLSMEVATSLAWLCLADDRVDEALGLTERAARTVALSRLWVWAFGVIEARVETLIRAGRGLDAAELVDDFERDIAHVNAPAAQAALATCRAIVLESRKDWASAAAGFATAASAWQALPRPYAVFMAMERQGRCLLHCNRDAGLAVLADAQRGLVRLGAAGDGERLSRLLREHGVVIRPVWRGGRRGYGNQLSPRELEVVRLVVTGMSNREIAKALSRSPKTVDTQLNSSMRKLGVSSRTALAVSVVEAGILAADPADDDRL